MTNDSSLTWDLCRQQPAHPGWHNHFYDQRSGPARAQGRSVFYDEEGKLWGEYNSTGALIQETIWLGDLPIATLSPNGGGFDIYYVHTDQLGTPRSVTRPSDNAIVWRWDNSEAFGNSASNDNPSGLGAFTFNLRYPGQYYDSETGKYYGCIAPARFCGSKHEGAAGNALAREFETCYCHIY